jgi:hypothetical protein
MSPIPSSNYSYLAKILGDLPALILGDYVSFLLGE